jgi:hypothetical protein
MKSSHTVLIQAESSAESNTEYQFNNSRLSDSSDFTVQENTCGSLHHFFCILLYHSLTPFPRMFW